MKPKVVVIRDHFFNQQASLGRCLVYIGDDLVFSGESLERGWVDNKNRVSCVPEGEYEMVLERSPRFRKDLWELKGVPGRSECKFHVSNYWWQLNGCIALGNSRAYIDGDHIMDIRNSRNAMDRFHKALEGYSEAKVIFVDARKIKPNA